MTRATHTMIKIHGTGISKGGALGPLRFFHRYTRYGGETPATGTPERETALFADSVKRAKQQLSELYENTKKRLGDKEAEIFNIHIMLLDDEEYRETAESYIFKGLSAPAAVIQTAQHFERMFAELHDDYLSARAADIRDVSQRLFRIMTGGNEGGVQSDDSPFILVADDLSPSETVQLDRKNLLGFVTFGGSASSHTAILARALGLPSLIGTGEISDEYDGTDAIINPTGGELIINPDIVELDRYTGELKRRAEEEKRLRGLIGRMSVTKSGRKIKLYANIAGADEADNAYANDAEGIGLLRSEFLYLGTTDYPDEESQFTAYRTVAEKMHGRPVIIRTLDIGADKKIDYFALPDEENPALGFRAIRICLARPDIFKTQLRAILRASAFGKVMIMLPMIVSAEEIRQARQILVAAKNELRYECVEFDEGIPLGVMIETPAAAMMSESLAREADFFSVGTNDLIQYTLAADRQNPSLSKLCRDNFEPVMRLIRIAADSAHDNGIWIGVCGELAADATMTQRFINIGIDELSVAAPRVLELREKIMECE